MRRSKKPELKHSKWTECDRGQLSYHTLHHQHEAADPELAVPEDVVHVAEPGEVDEDVDDDHRQDIDKDSGNFLIFCYPTVVSFSDFI